MKKNKLVIIGIFIILIILLCISNTYAFSKGDSVQCKIKSYAYDFNVYTATNPSLNTFVRNSAKSFKKGTILKYIQDMKTEGICQVEYQNEKFYVKEVNLTSYTEGIPAAGERVAQQVYDKYANADLSKLDPILLVQASNECFAAKQITIDSELKIKLAQEAEKRGMTVNEDKSLRKQWTRL